MVSLVGLVAMAIHNKIGYVDDGITSEISTNEELRTPFLNVVVP